MVLFACFSRQTVVQVFSAQPEGQRNSEQDEDEGLRRSLSKCDFVVKDMLTGGTLQLHVGDIKDDESGEARHEATLFSVIL